MVYDNLIVRSCLPSW